MTFPGPIKLNLDTKVPVAQGFLTMFPRAVYAVTRASQVGFAKYGKWFNPVAFASGNDPALLLDALGRHILDEAINGPINVEKGGALPADGMTVRHAAQVAWEAMARLELIIIQEEEAVKKLAPKPTTMLEDYMAVSRDTSVESNVVEESPLPTLAEK